MSACRAPLARPQRLACARQLSGLWRLLPGVHLYALREVHAVQAAAGAALMSEQLPTHTDVLSAVRWWPGRTDEVHRVADRLRALDLPDGEMTVGEIARRTGSDVAITLDAIEMNDTVAAAINEAARESAAERRQRVIRDAGRAVRQGGVWLRPARRP